MLECSWLESFEISDWEADDATWGHWLELFRKSENRASSVGSKGILLAKLLKTPLMG